MAEETRTGLPASFELAWGLRSAPTKGPRRGLSLELIVAAGVELAAAEGLGAVSMSRVAGKLGTSAMSLYRYVASKDELLALMVDATVTGVPSADGGDAGGWRAGLERWAWHVLGIYRRHPWVIQVPVNGPPITPNQIAILEHGLRCLAGVPLAPAEKMSVMLTLTSYVRAWASLTGQLDAALAAGDRTAIETMTNFGKIFSVLADRAEFPALYEMVDAGALDDADESPDADFAFGLTVLLDGVEARVSS